MITTVEYALLAGASYVSNRAPVNQFPIPLGWTPFFHVPEQSEPSFPAASGFEARSFIKGNEIVISYAGTNFSDKFGDSVYGTVLATGLLGSQLLDAARYYLRVKADNPGAHITFTGQSLGGDWPR